MGYSITQRDSSFFIKKEDEVDALNALKNMKTPLYILRARGWDETYSLAEALSIWGWETDTDEDGNIDYLELRSDKLADDADMFMVIAPWVREDSYIIMFGEDGYTWQWFFNGLTCVELQGTITYG